MDTSDGLLATLDQLMRLNEKGFVLDRPWDEVLDPDVAALCDRTHTPPWLMAAGPHGEFALAFTVPGQDVKAFLAECRERALKPIPLGSVSNTMALEHRPDGERSTMIDMIQIRNLSANLSDNMEILQGGLQ
jgi:thiamine monophosphate kinase